MINQKIIMYAILHFIVDFCCAFLMFRLSFQVKDFYIYFFIYNFCAFALQMPVGLVADKWNHGNLAAAAGCCITGIAFFLSVVLVPTDITIVSNMAVVLAGIGNCLFHVGGGIEVQDESKDRLTPLGIFVSPGAIGIYLGTILGKDTAIRDGIPLLLLLLGTVCLFWHIYRHRKETDVEKGFVQKRGQYQKSVMAGALLCLLGVVVLRSHLGMIFTFPWKITQAGAVFGLLAVVFGKMAGGFLADKIGLGKACVFSVLPAICCFGFAQFPFFGVLGLFFFNMSMPMTLSMAAEILKPCRGFAFGILTFAIFIGFLPAYLGYRYCAKGVLVIYSLISGILLIIGWWLIHKNKLCARS